MKSMKLMVIGIAVAAILLGVPALSYATIKSTTESLDITVTAINTAALNSATFGATMRLMPAVEKPSYTAYIGDFWASTIGLGSSVSSYPQIRVTILDTDKADRVIPDQAFAYTYGEAWTHTIKLPVNPGQHISILMQMFSADSRACGGGAAFDYIVPGGV